MIWVCMAASGRGNLVFIIGKTEKLPHFDFLKQNLRQLVENLELPDDLDILSILFANGCYTIRESSFKLLHKAPLNTYGII